MNARLDIIARVSGAVAGALVIVIAALVIVPSEHWFSHRGLALWGAILVISAAIPFIRGGNRVGPLFRWLAGLLAAAFLAGGGFLLYLFLGTTREWQWALPMIGVCLLGGAFFGYAAWRGRSVR